MRTGVEKVENTKKLTLAEAMEAGRDSVTDALTYLTSAKVQNFYARVINLMDRVAVPGFGTMAVSAHKGKYLFLYDPLFAATVSYEEVCATCEHEVMHLILEHIPRHQAMARLFQNDEDKHLMAITANLAMDLADNELLARSWPKIKHDKKPLGDWVIPEGFTPKLPADLSYENYQRLLIDLLNSRLSSSPAKLYSLAKQILKKQAEAVKDALQQQSKNNGSGEEESQDDAGQGQGQSPSPSQGQAPGQGGQGQGQGSEQGQGQGSGQGQGQGQGQGSGQGQDQGQDDPLDNLSPEELKSELQNLDPMDGKILEMLLNAMRPHIAWDTGNFDESDTHKLLENGRELIKTTVTSSEKSRGTIPGHVMELIRKMLMPPTVPWTQFLHNIVQRTRQTKKSRGMSRPSKKLAALKVFAHNKEEEDDIRFRRYARIQRMPVFPGIKHSNKYTIYYVVDTSGSMSSKELELGLSELLHIQKSDSEVSICVIYADTHICKEYWITGSGEIDNKLTGRGGTDFELVFQHVKKMQSHQDKAPDILIYCTDGYAPPPDTKLSIPTVWLLTPRGQPVMKESGHITIMMKDYQLEDPSV